MALQKQQWEAEMALQKQQLAKSSSSSKSSSGSSYTVNNETVNNQPTINQSYQKLYENLSKAKPSNNLNKQIFRNLIHGEVKNANITAEEAQSLFDEFGL